jgi:hypothetical protein
VATNASATRTLLRLQSGKVSADFPLTAGLTPDQRGGLPARPAADASLSLADQIAGLGLELAALKAQQAEAFLMTIAAVIPPGLVFSARELWRHQTVSADLREAFQAAGLTNVRRLGRRLEQLQRLSGAVQIERLGIDCDGVRWMVKGLRSV